MFKKFISAGLLFWIPLIFTVWILDSVIEFSDRLLVFLPTQQLPAFLAKIPGLGLIFAVIIIFLTGVIVANVLGKKIVSWWEALLDRRFLRIHRSYIVNTECIEEYRPTRVRIGSIEIEISRKYKEEVHRRLGRE